MSIIYSTTLIEVLPMSLAADVVTLASGVVGVSSSNLVAVFKCTQVESFYWKLKATLRP